ncbi:hypothetical protein N7532_003385 [Penicillium argentinense]|uniref:Mediator of RNA polymerase II transcription subunit 14 n=1 Tax=Penicillium argentinense TaxID=1131581 RepID=A0A9W9KEH2_9EURO|nr:uncharacterized protein N7532_003385 [Penicillium argentinense]KAJ5102856.1 hypothetical protein N7532_003385 [Penicillium argentinense]
MPGVVMDSVNVEGSGRRPSPNEAVNGAFHSYGINEKSSQLPVAANGPALVNGVGREPDALSQQSKAPVRHGEQLDSAPFDLPHITQGFFPFGTLVNRAVQQCWNDLSELIAELAAIQVPHDPSSAQMVNGKVAGNQSSENLHKKVKILDFAHAKRAEFIKLLVLSQWSRQASEVSRLIDIQNFIRTRHQAYAAAVQYVGEMKQDLVRAQVANPDLKTALEILSKGRIASLPDFGYKPPKTLTARSTLLKLHKINRIISVRLVLHDEVPRSLRNYRVHDGRVTFTVPGEFELDLSVAEEAKSSQFFFVDIRFLFSPSSPIPKGRIFNQLDAKINDVLRNEGLVGCFDFLHGLVLTNKISILHRQAVDLVRGAWSNVLHIELLHRILVVQYWPTRTSQKSWLEIGVQRGKNSYRDDRVSYLGLRWIRDGEKVSSEGINFDPTVLSLECILRSAIALHASHILTQSFFTLKKNLLFARSELSLRAHLSPMEPGDCYLDVQLTRSRSLKVSVEPSTGAIAFFGPSSTLERERGQYKSAVEELFYRVTRLRCHSAVEQIESGTRPLGLENISQSGLGVDVRQLFPSNTVRFSLLGHRHWDRRWVVAATSSMDGDRWYLVPVRTTEPARTVPTYTRKDGSSLVHPISDKLIPSGQVSYSACSELVRSLTGMLAIYVNARCLAYLPGAQFHPPLKQLKLGPNFEVPDLVFKYKPQRIPAVVRLALPPVLRKRSYVRDSIRLSFEGIDAQTHSTVVVAYGSLRFSAKTLLPLISKTDPSLAVQEKGSGFSLRLLAPVGQSVLIGLLERLQRLDCILYILQSLMQKGMRLQSLSLSQISFSYGQDHNLSAQFGIDTTGPSPSTYIDIPSILSNPIPLFSLRFRIDFDIPSPHRRLQEALTVALNARFSESGVESVLGSIAETSPLLHCLDQITKSTEATSVIVLVTVRSPTVFQIQYAQNSQFRLSARPRQGHKVWLLEDFNPSGSPGRGKVYDAVRGQVYNSRGDGWQGLGDGALSSIDKVGNLITKLHECLSACPTEPVKQEQPGYGQRPGTMNQPSVTSVAKAEQVSPQNAAPGNTDVITID